MNRCSVFKMFIVGLLITGTLLFVLSCDVKKGSLYPNMAPKIRISSFNGTEVEQGDSIAAETDDESDIFQQQIFWVGHDDDGWIEGYAYRVLNTDWEPIPTPFNEVLDNDGWVYHFKEGANENDPNHPLGDPSVSTIWTEEVNATINFPAADANGDSTMVPSVFEVKCIDDKGTESDVARKLFYATSRKPEIIISTTRGEIDDKTVGLGVHFQFAMSDPDEYIPTPPYYFEYKIVKIDTLTNEVIPMPEYDWYDTWFSTQDNPAVTDAILVGYPEPNPPYPSWISSPPYLLSDFDENGNQVSQTRLTVRGKDLAGIWSDPVDAYFTVSPQFTPETLIYKYNIWVLGSNHFTTYQDQAINIVIPTMNTPEGEVFSTPFFQNRNGHYVALWSQDIEINMHWGFKGEYESNSPREKKLNTVLDQDTSINYYSEVIAFDVRLNGDFYYLPRLAEDPNFEEEYLVVDPDGKRWIRIPRYLDESQEPVLTNLAATDPNDLDDFHVLEVRAVDLQGKVDPTPATYRFKLDMPLAPEDKEGILVLDDEEDHNTYSPAGVFDEIYLYLLSDFGLTQDDILKRKELQTTVWDDSLHFGKDVFSPTDLQRCKVIVYHCDKPDNSLNSFALEYDVLNLYLRGGGNIILTGTWNLNKVYTDCYSTPLPILEDYFGIERGDDAEDHSIRYIEGNVMQNPFFVEAVSQAPGYPDIPIDLVLQEFVDAGSPIVNLIGPRQGLGAMAYLWPYNLSSYSGMEILYTLGCKPIDAEVFPPTQEQFDLFNGKPMVSKFTRPIGLHPGTQTCSIWCFPPPYMQRTEMKQAFVKLINEMMNQ